MKRLITRMLAIGLVAVLSFALVFGLVVNLGLQSLVDGIDRENDQRLSAELSKRLSAIESGSDGAESVSRVLDGLSVKTEFLAVKTGSGVLLFASKKDRVMAESERKNVVRELAATQWSNVLTADSKPLEFAFRTIHVASEESTRILVAAVGQIVVVASIIAIVLSSLVAFLLANPISRQTRTLATTLSQMRVGSRDIVLPLRGPTELREIASCVMDLQKALRREEELRSQWAADVAHDLRTPLSVLKGQFEGMIDGVLPPDHNRLVRNYEEIQRLEQLVNQLAELTHIESPGFRLDTTTIDVRGMLNRQVQRFAIAAAAREIEIVLEDDLPMTTEIKGDESLVDRAVANLMDNAIRYARSASALIVRIDRLPETLSIIVDNSGLIPEEDRTRVFDRLFRGDQSRSSPGTGLGLAIAQAVAQAHGGSITLTSNQVGCRTVFRLNLPA